MSVFRCSNRVAPIAAPPSTVANHPSMKVFVWSTSPTNISLFSFINLIQQTAFSSLPNVVIENRHRIEHLILDGNKFTEHSLNVPPFDNLVTLSLNSNRIRNVAVLLKYLGKQCPKLTFLSLIGNPGWPHPISTHNPSAYYSYRKLAARCLPHLKFLDSTIVERRSRNIRNDSRKRKDIAWNIPSSSQRCL
uniref:U2A'/phosphoprotein 32 family A C-terminal domain-containing protein n=1 Tax=Ascaris lumbricoides TaxID=6252 RepID=A0A9J2P695_ASCLU